MGESRREGEGVSVYGQKTIKATLADVFMTQKWTSSTAHNEKVGRSLETRLYEGINKR